VNDPYPVQFSIDYPERNLDRLSSFFRVFTVIPIAIVLAAISGWPGGFHWGNAPGLAATGTGVLFVPVALMLVGRQKYPRWWFDWNLNFQRFANRVAVYLLLMDDRYPSTDDEQGVRLDFPFPDAEAELSRWLPLVKWLLAIPHYIVLAFLFLGVFFAVIAAWFAILFTGQYPRAIFDYVSGVLRWHNRVVGYAFGLVTDRYPPFTLAP
jgi:Domain of unknown function (DUF4389)